MNTIEKIIVDNDFIKQYRNLIYKEIRQWKIKDEELVEELYVLVIIRIMETVDNYNSIKGAVSTWLTYQVRSVISNFFKAKKRSNDVMDIALQMPEDIEVLHDQMDEESVSEERDDNINLAYDFIYESDLTEYEKKVLYDHFISGFSILEMSKERGLGHRQLRRTINQLVERLRKLYEVKEKI